jgi:hypothetical protein
MANRVWVSGYITQSSRTTKDFYSTLGCTAPSSFGHSTVLPFVLSGASPGSLITSTILEGPGENAYSIQLRWKASDTMSQLITTTTQVHHPSSIPANFPCRERGLTHYTPILDFNPHGLTHNPSIHYSFSH